MFKVEMETVLLMGVRKKKKYSLTMNNYRNWFFMVNNNLKKLYKEVAAKKLKERGNVYFKEPIYITFVFYKGRKARYDLDGMCGVHIKFFCDALVELGYIEDDDCDHIKGISNIYGGYDKGKQRVEIVIDKF